MAGAGAIAEFMKSILAAREAASRAQAGGSAQREPNDRGGTAFSAPGAGTVPMSKIRTGGAGTQMLGASKGTYSVLGGGGGASVGIPDGALGAALGGTAAGQQIAELRNRALQSVSGPPTPEQPSTNPFLAGAKRVAMVPVNAVKLPFRLTRELVGKELLNDPRFTSPDEAARLQRDLSQQVTGQEVPFSEGRDMANLFSLGLVPGNPAANIDPSQLQPDQQQRFDQLSPIQQRLLQAKRPQDFAEMIQDGSLFEERAPEKLAAVQAGTRLVDPKTGEVKVDAQYAPQNVSPGGAIVQGGDELYRNDQAAPVDESVADRNRAAAEASRASADLSSQKIDESKAKIAELDAKADAAAQAAANGPEPIPIKDRNTISTMEARTVGQVSKRTKDLERGFTAGRNFMKLYELRGANRLSPAMRREIESMGFRDVGNDDPRAQRSLALMVLGVRATDPPGRISDSEQKIWSAARSRFDPGIVRALMNGETLTDTQTNELALVVKGLTEGAIQSNDMAVVDGRKAALRDRIAGRGVGMNPMNIPDQAADLRSLFYGSELGDQAAYPLADSETEALLEQLWFIANPDRNPTPGELVEFANTHGFRVNELGE